MRADAKRNYDRIVAAANELVARDGVDVSLEEVAQRAGLGSATLHRHFDGRRDLLNAVFRDRVTQLCDRAGAVAASPAAGSEWSDLVAWLHQLMQYAATTRGLAATLLAMGEPLSETSTCSNLLGDAATTLIERARAVGAIQPDTTAQDVVMLVVGLSHAAQGDPDKGARLLDLALGGVRCPPTGRASPVRSATRPA